VEGIFSEEMNGILLVGDGSIVEGIKLDSLSLTAQARDGIIDLYLY
jgi:hypothetical protein